MPQTHVCIASDQVIPNLMACLHYRPTTVHLIVSSAMTKEGQRLKTQLEAQKIDCVVHRGLPGDGLNNLIEYATRLAGDLASSEPAGHVVFNVTGGTKLMALATYIGFVNALESFSIVYTDTDHGRFEFLSLDGEYTPQPIPGNLLDVPTYLAAQGYRVTAIRSNDPKWRSDTTARAGLSAYFAENALALRDFFGELNDAVRRCYAPGKGKSRRLEYAGGARPWKVDPGNACITWACDTMKSMGLVSFPSPRKVEFRNENAASYLGGGWLEEYVWTCAASAGLFDVRCGVEFVDDASKARNEIDLVAVHDNRVTIVECKTEHLRQDSKAADRVYKFDSLGQRVARHFSHRWFVSARPMDENAKKRARGYDIEVFQVGALANLTERFRRLARS